MVLTAAAYRGTSCPAAPAAEEAAPIDRRPVLSGPTIGRSHFRCMRQVPVDCFARSRVKPLAVAPRGLAMRVPVLNPRAAAHPRRLGQQGVRPGFPSQEAVVAERERACPNSRAAVEAGLAGHSSHRAAARQRPGCSTLRVVAEQSQERPSSRAAVEGERERPSQQAAAVVAGPVRRPSHRAAGQSLACSNLQPAAARSVRPSQPVVEALPRQLPASCFAAPLDPRDCQRACLFLAAPTRLAVLRPGCAASRMILPGLLLWPSSFHCCGRASGLQRG